MDLLSQDLEVAAGEAYKAVEAMARSHRLSAWKSSARPSSEPGLGKTATDLEMLWASSQLYRHDQSQAGAARKVLGTRPELDYGRCCWAAAEILEAYCLGKQTGAF
jgi:hypothetical protein